MVERVYDCVSFLFKRECRKPRKERAAACADTRSRRFGEPCESVKFIAAVRIQSMWRGRTARQWVNHLIEMHYCLAVHDRMRTNSYNYRILWKPSAHARSSESALARAPTVENNNAASGASFEMRDGQSDTPNDDPRLLFCAICLQQSTTWAACCQIETKCLHRYHYNCMYGYVEWRETRNLPLYCPMCRTDIRYRSPVLRRIRALSRALMSAADFLSDCCGVLSVLERRTQALDVRWAVAVPRM
eukprot:GEMP01061344.1.p1 GENE.GEMP01061344.1~~GEMP01061344.1.p1  ORF type:complete len:245 (+),score=34.80 GEMP01061344.1:135-869(+)